MTLNCPRVKVKHTGTVHFTSHEVVAEGNFRPLCRLPLLADDVECTNEMVTCKRCLDKNEALRRKIYGS